MSKHYAVFGHPVAHSLSPRIHTAFGRQAGIEIDYIAIDATPAAFDDALAEFGRRGGAGANVTLPLKQSAYALCRDTTERARRAGAVNTLVRNGDTWHGDNTDGAGIVRDLTGRHALDLRARRTLLSGRGGRAAVAPTLLARIGDCSSSTARPSAPTRWSTRSGTWSRARALLRRPARAREFELIVNANSPLASVKRASRGSVVVVAAAPPLLIELWRSAIPFLAWARANGCHDAVDGLGMLVEQAAESFARWHGVMPDTDAIYGELRAEHARLVTAD